MCYEEKRRLVQADRLLQLAIVVQEEDIRFTQRVDRVPGFHSSRPHWLPTPPSTASECPPPPPGPYWFQKERTHSLAEEGGRGESGFGRKDRHSGTLCLLYDRSIEASSSLSVKLVPAGVEISITSASCLHSSSMNFNHTTFCI